MASRDLCRRRCHTVSPRRAMREGAVSRLARTGALLCRFLWPIARPTVLHCHRAPATLPDSRCHIARDALACCGAPVPYCPAGHATLPKSRCLVTKAAPPHWHGGHMRLPRAVRLDRRYVLAGMHPRWNRETRRNEVAGSFPTVACQISKIRPNPSPGSARRPRPTGATPQFDQKPIQGSPLWTTGYKPGEFTCAILRSQG